MAAFLNDKRRGQWCKVHIPVEKLLSVAISFQITHPDMLLTDVEREHRAGGGAAADRPEGPAAVGQEGRARLHQRQQAHLLSFEAQPAGFCAVDNLRDAVHGPDGALRVPPCHLAGRVRFCAQHRVANGLPKI